MSRGPLDRLGDGSGLWMTQTALGGLGDPMMTAALHYALQPIGEIANSRGLVPGPQGQGAYTVDLVGTTAGLWMAGGLSLTQLAMLTIVHGVIHLGTQRL